MPEYKKLSVKEQGNKTWYTMSLRFIADAIPTETTKMLNELNDFMQHVGCQDTYTINDNNRPTITLKLEQTVPFVPDRETIQKYVNIMESKLKDNKEITIKNIRFDGYNYIYPIEPPSKQKENNNELEDNN